MNSRPVAVVTGAFGSLGGAVARVLAARGAAVGLIGRGAKPPDEVAKEFSEGHLIVAGVELTDRASAERAMQTIAARLGAIDALVNLAGAYASERFEDGNVDTWQSMFDANLKSAVVATRAALPHLLERGAGRIVNVAAIAAHHATAGNGAYAAAKAGVLRFTEALADELAPRHITVNAILPGTIDTPQNRAAMPDADRGDWVAPQALADVIAWLLSDAATAVTGAAIPVGRG